MGAMPPTPAMTFSTRTSWAPVARSTITARPITIAQPPAKPCTRRAVIITAIVGVTAHATDASVMTRTAASSGRRRPRWSDTGPPISCPRAIPTKKVVRVSWTWVAVPPRSLATRGNAGTYISVARGAIAVRNTTVATRPEASRAWTGSRCGWVSGWSPRYSQSGQ